MILIFKTQNWPPWFWCWLQLFWALQFQNSPKLVTIRELEIANIFEHFLFKTTHCADNDMSFYCYYFEKDNFPQNHSFFYLYFYFFYDVLLKFIKFILRQSCALVYDSNLVICGILIHHYMVKLGNETNKVLLCLINFSRNLFPMIMTSHNPYNSEL